MKEKTLADSSSWLSMLEPSSEKKIKREEKEGRSRC
jgi:hypothetical protein